MKRVVILTVFIILTINCKGWAMAENVNTNNKIIQAYKDIDISKGVNKQAAILIAQKYLIDTGRDSFLNISKIKKIEEKNHVFGDKYWFVSFSTTLKTKIAQGLSWGVVLVDKTTGIAEYVGEGPS